MNLDKNQKCDEQITSQKHLSLKKTVSQTFSLSPALKEWLKRYMRVKHRELPDDIQYKSISSFITSLVLSEISQDEKSKGV